MILYQPSLRQCVLSVARVVNRPEGGEYSAVCRKVYQSSFPASYYFDILLQFLEALWQRVKRQALRFGSWLYLLIKPFLELEFSRSCNPGRSHGSWELGPNGFVTLQGPKWTLGLEDHDGQETG